MIVVEDSNENVPGQIGNSMRYSSGNTGENTAIPGTVHISNAFQLYVRVAFCTTGSPGHTQMWGPFSEARRA